MIRATVHVLGFGKVARELVKLVLRMGARDGLELVGVTASRGTVIAEGPADKAALLRLAEERRRLDDHPSFHPGLTGHEGPLATGADIALVAIPPSYETGEPNLTIYRELLGHGVSVVTADKTGLALDYRGLREWARRGGALLAYRATVAAGTPVLDAARALRRRGVEEVRAVLNATTNYVLGLLAEGLSLEEAIRRSIEAGLAEPDPRTDLEGWDAAAKLAIILNELGIDTTIRDVERRPFPRELPAGVMVRQVAVARIGGRPIVGVEPIPPGDPLERAVGERSVAVFRLEGDSVVVEGPAGPAWRTARVMYADALEVAERLAGGD